MAISLAPEIDFVDIPVDIDFRRKGHQERVSMILLMASK